METTGKYLIITTVHLHDYYYDACVRACVFVCVGACVHVCQKVFVLIIMYFNSIV